MDLTAFFKPDELEASLPLLYGHRTLGCKQVDVNSQEKVFIMTEGRVIRVATPRCAPVADQSTGDGNWKPRDFN